MAIKSDLQIWVMEALKQLGGSGNIVQVCKLVWEQHEDELRRSGDLFYTWQYDIRWSAERLRKSGRMKTVADSTPGIWELQNNKTGGL